MNLQSLVRQPKIWFGFLLAALSIIAALCLCTPILHYIRWSYFVHQANSVSSDNLFFQDDRRKLYLSALAEAKAMGPNSAQLAKSCFYAAGVATTPEESISYLQRSLSLEENALGAWIPDCSTLLMC